jgi:hypothetical protein
VVTRTNKTAKILLRLECRWIGQGVHGGTKNHQAQQARRDSASHRSRCPSFFRSHTVRLSQWIPFVGTAKQSNAFRRLTASHSARHTRFRVFIRHCPIPVVLAVPVVFEVSVAFKLPQNAGGQTKIEFTRRSIRCIRVAVRKVKMEVLVSSDACILIGATNKVRALIV